MSSSSARALIWRSRLGEWWANTWRWMLMAVGTVIGVYLILDRGVADGAVSAVVIGVLVIGVAVTGRTPLALALIAIPAVVISARVGLGDSDLTVSDAALAAGFASAILLGQRPYSRPFKALLWLNLVYQFATLFTVIVNPFAANTTEWFHAWLLVSGALIVGWAIGRGGYARYAFGALLVAGCVIALGAIGTGIAQYLHKDLGPVYPVFPWPMQKNFAGTTMAFIALIAYMNPPWARLPREWTWSALWILLIAIAMTQSRQAWIALAVVGVIVVARRGGHSRIALLLAIPAVWLTISMVIDQVNSQNQFNSVYQRLNWFEAVLHYWKPEFLVGHGLRFWYVDPTLGFQPPQAELEVAASAGLVGLLAFGIMFLGMLIVLWRVNPVYGTLAFVAVLSRLVQAQFDLFWVSVSVSVPFVIAGICLGALARDTSTVEGGADAATLSDGSLAAASPAPADAR